MSKTMYNALILTWPKARTLDSYLSQLERAREESELAYFKVPSTPSKLKGHHPRTYMLHDGEVHGYLEVEFIGHVKEGVPDSVTGYELDPGIYIVRSPIWHPIEPWPMKGFRGYRYCNG